MRYVGSQKPVGKKAYKKPPQVFFRTLTNVGTTLNVNLSMLVSLKKARLVLVQVQFYKVLLSYLHEVSLVERQSHLQPKKKLQKNNSY